MNWGDESGYRGSACEVAGAWRRDAKGVERERGGPARHEGGEKRESFVKINGVHVTDGIEWQGDHGRDAYAANEDGEA